MDVGIFASDLGLVLFAMIIGMMMGSLTGLIPGFHVNTVAMVLLTLTPLFVSYGIPLKMVAVIIISCGTVHTFVGYVPAALLGAPEDSTALALLPGHRMLLAGHAPLGVAWSARGSQLGLLLSLPLLVVGRILFGPELGLYQDVRTQLPWILLGITLMLLYTERTRLDWPEFIQRLSGGRLGEESRLAGTVATIAYFLLCGFYGLAVFALPAKSPVGLPGPSMLGPALAGLFGVAGLLDIMLTMSHIPEQHDEWTMPPAKPIMGSCFGASSIGAMMGFLPGMTAAQATVLVMSGRNMIRQVTDPSADMYEWEGKANAHAMRGPQHQMLAAASLNVAGGTAAATSARRKFVPPERTAIHEKKIQKVWERTLRMKEKMQPFDPDESKPSENDLEVIAVLSAVNTAVTVMVLGWLYIIARPRSGAALVLDRMYPIDYWIEFQPPGDFITFVGVTIASGLIAVPLMLRMGRWFLKIHAAIPLHALVIGVIVFLALLSWVQSGMLGLLVMFVGAALGFMPQRIGIRRSHSMAIILFPIMLYLFDYRYGWVPFV